MVYVWLQVILFTRDEVILGAIERWDIQGEEGDPTPEIVQQLLKAKELHRPGTGDAGARASSRASVRYDQSGAGSGKQFLPHVPLLLLPSSAITVFLPVLKRKTRVPSPAMTYREVSSRESGRTGDTEGSNDGLGFPPEGLLGQRPTTAAAVSPKPKPSGDGEGSLSSSFDIDEVAGDLDRAMGKEHPAAPTSSIPFSGKKTVPLVPSPVEATSLTSGGRMAEAAARSVVPAIPPVRVGDSVMVRSMDDVVRGRTITFQIEDTWGDRYYAGLCGLQVLTLNPQAGVPFHQHLARLGIQAASPSISTASAVALTTPEAAAKVVDATTRSVGPLDTFTLPEDLPNLGFLWQRSLADVAVPPQSQVFRVEEVPLQEAQLAAKPRDINVNGHTGDPRTLDKLIDGHCITNDDLHMWLIPWDPPGTRPSNAKPPVLEIDLGSEQYIVGVSGKPVHRPSHQHFIFLVRGFVFRFSITLLM